MEGKGNLSLTQRLDEIHGRTPLPPGARLHQTLEVAMQHVRRLEPQHLDGRHRRQLLPEPRPQAGGLDRDPGDRPHLGDDLRLVAEVGDEDDVACRDDQQRAGSGEPGEVSDVRETGEQQSVEVCRRQAVHERGESHRPHVDHAPASRRRSSCTSPRKASSYPCVPRPTTTPSAADASMECRRSGSRA